MPLNSDHPPMHRRVRPWIGACLAAAALAPLAVRAQSDDQFEIEQETAVALAEQMQWFDYADLQIAGARERFSKPDQKEALLLTEAEVKRLQGKTKDAADLLAKVPKSSSNYAPSLITRVRLTKEPKEKQDLLGEFFKLVKKPKPGAQAQMYQDAVLRSAQIYMDEGNVEGAKKQLKLLDNMPSSDEDGDDRGIKFRTARLLLDAADKLARENAKPESYRPFVEEAEKILNPLVFNMDLLAGMANVELARCKVLNGKPDDAVSLINNSAQILRDMEKAVVEAGVGRGASPLAGAYYVLGEAFMAKAEDDKERGIKAAKAKKEAEQNGAREDMKANLTKAAGMYYKVTNEYSKSPYSKDAQSRFALVTTILKALGVQFDIGDRGDRQVLLTAAETAYKDEKYKEAMVKYQEAVQMDPTSADAPDLLFRLSVCQLKTNDAFDILCALVTADYMATQFPESPRTADALYNCGLIFGQQASRAKAAGATAPEESYRAFSNLAFMRLVEVAPEDHRAAVAGYRVAETLYSEAMEARREMKALEGDDDKVDEFRAKRDEVKAILGQAIPVYEALTRSHGTSDQGIQSYYKLGWIYMLLERDQDAATNFLLYCEANDKPSDSRAIAKFYAAERFMRANAVDDAVINFREFLEWTKPGSGYEMNERLSANRADAAAFIPWCMDKKAQLATDKVEAFGDDILELEDKIKSGKAKEEYDKLVKDMGENAEGVETPEARLANMKAALEKYQQESKSFENDALDSFLAYVKANPTNDRHTPPIMQKLGVMYKRRGDIAETVRWLNRLNEEFPATVAGQQALFTLFQSLVESDKMQEAKDIGSQLKTKLKDYPTGNVDFIAKSLLIQKGNGPVTGILDADLAIAANQELIDRSKDPKHKDARSLKALGVVAYYRIAQAYLLSKKYDEAVAAVETANKVYTSSPYYYRLVAIQGEALTKSGKSDQGMRVLGEALSKINYGKYPVDYMMLTDAICRISVTLDTKEQVASAINSGKPALDFYTGENSELTPYVESIYVQVAHAYSLLGMTDQAEKMKTDYLLKFPNGALKKSILFLPPKKF